MNTVIEKKPWTHGGVTVTQIEYIFGMVIITSREFRSCKGLLYVYLSEGLIDAEKSKVSNSVTTHIVTFVFGR
jgi:hypothetical protein